jgi:surface carbohydrate biosynthesis protein (TIGR04326 family)
MRVLVCLVDPGQPLNKDGLVVAWNAISFDEHVISVLDYIEDHSYRLRKKYLSFVHGFGEYEIKNKKIVEHLSEKRGYNLWWMSDIAAKSYLNSQAITDCIKLLALEEILSENDTDSVVIYANDNTSPVCDAIHSLCVNLDISYTYKIVGKKNKREYKKLLKRFQPEWLSVLRYLYRYLKSHKKIFNKKNMVWFSEGNSISFFSYLYHLDIKKSEKGEFYSKQWGRLPSILRDLGLTLNWVHHDWAIKSADTAQSWIEGFNSDPEQEGSHSLFENHLNTSLIVQAFLNYCRLYLKSFYLLNIRKAFQPIGSKVDFWPLLKRDWCVSLRGGAAMRNWLFVETVDNMLKTIPKQGLGLYVQENMYWERALLHGWRYHNHGNIIGTPIATINFWDLRYSEDSRTVKDINRSFALPLPDIVALHGPVAKEHYYNAGYPSKSTAEVEALRYLYLEEKIKSNSVAINNYKKDKIKILVLGEIKADSTLEILTIVQAAVVGKCDISITLKSHPVCPIDTDQLKKTGVLITDEPIEKILSIFDLVIVAGATSAAIDAYYAEVNIIVFLGKHELNLSPLRGFDDVKFVRTSYELESAIDFYSSENKKIRNMNYFFIGNDLSRWKSLIGRYVSI